MTDTPRAATSPELVKLRKDNQASQLYLIAYAPPTVYTAQLAAVPSSTDEVASITHNTNSGNVSDIKTDMTLLVGSSAGAYDLGICRMRLDGVAAIVADSTTFYIAEESDVRWNAGGTIYLTVIDDFGLWPRHIRINPADGTTPWMDYNVPYTNQNQTAGISPVPIMGPHRVKWLTGSTVVTTWDCSNSWTLGTGSNTYAWTFTGASATTGTTTTTPTATYNAAGVYRAELTITGNNGVAFTGYRYIFVIDPANPPSWLITQFSLNNCSGAWQQGGWSSTITLYAQANVTTIRDRALCILFARDWYGATTADEGSIGWVTDVENIIVQGWIAGETIDWQPPALNSRVEFEIQGPHYWLDKMTGFPAGVKDTSTTPNKWTKFNGLTVPKAWFHWLMWRTTAPRCIDVYPITDANRPTSRLEAPGAQSIWQQLKYMGEKTIFASPCADRYGRLYFQIEQSLVPTGSRSAWPTVMTLTSADWQNDINFQRVITQPISSIDLSGVWWDHTAMLPTPIFSLAMGRVYAHYGLPDMRDRLYITGTTAADAQTNANTLAALYYSWRNSEFPSLQIRQASNNRLFDIVPFQRAAWSIASTDTLRGLTRSLNLVPKRISYNLDQYNVLTTDIDFEKETDGSDAIGITGDTPATTPTVQPPTCPPGTHDDGTGTCIPDIVPPIVPGTTNTKEVWFATNRYIVWSSDFFGGGQPTWNKVASLPGTIVYFFISSDGSYVYLIGSDGVHNHIWVSTNPKAGSPTWTSIAEVGTTTPTGTSLGQIYTARWYKGHLIAILDHGSPYTYAEHDGVTWTTLKDLPHNVMQGGVGDRVYVSDISGSSYRNVYNVDSGAKIGECPQDGYVGTSSTIWRRNTGGDYIAAGCASTGGQTYIRNITQGTNLLSLSDPSLLGPFGLAPRGAYTGLELDYVDHLGNLWIATDGATFVNTFTWQPGVVEQSKLVGGGSLIWLTKSTTNSNEMIRMSTDHGITWKAMTGNFWTTIDTSGLDFFGVNLQLVF